MLEVAEWLTASLSGLTRNELTTQPLGQALHPVLNLDLKSGALLGESQERLPVEIQNSKLPGQQPQVP